MTAVRQCRIWLYAIDPAVRLTDDQYRVEATSDAAPCNYKTNPGGNLQPSATGLQAAGNKLQQPGFR